MSGYQRSTYQLRRFELVVPHVRNDGSAASGWLALIRSALTVRGFDGWTEIETLGYWHGKPERGTTFVIFSEDMRDDHVTEARTSTADLLAEIGRAIMDDQEAIQLVIGEVVTLREA